MPRRAAKNKIVRFVGLHDHQSAFLSASGSARDLRDQLKGSLARTVVWNVQTDIRRDHADQPHIVKIQSLGDKLRADENIGFSL